MELDWDPAGIVMVFELVFNTRNFINECFK